MFIKQIGTLFITMFLCFNFVFAEDNVTIENENQIIELYIATFNRAPDKDGLDYWLNEMTNNSWSIEMVAKSMFMQTETKSLYPDDSNTSVLINSVYENVLNRVADSEGFDYWSEDLSNGNISREYFIIAIINGAKADSGSEEDSTLLTNKVEVGRYFAIEKNQNDINLSKTVMKLITSDDTSVTSAKSVIDSSSTSTINYSSHEESSDYIWNEDEVISITLNSNLIETTSQNVTITESNLTINSSGTYTLSGSLSDGQIIVDSDDDGVVRLILNNVDISNSTSSAIFIKNAKKTIIILADNSNNYISDASSYAYSDPEEDEPDSAIFSKDDLSFYGNGSLSVTANYNDGVKSKDGLVINSGNIIVNSLDDSIVGKDYIVIKGGNLTLNAGGDSLKSTNDSDSTKGYILISGGVINSNSVNDSIQAETNLKITAGEITIISGGGSETIIDEDTSAKGLKAGADMIIDNGIFSINSADDTIHANNSMVINGGEFKLSSGDDGMHSDTSLEINAGTINITKSYEGIESAILTINDGLIHIVASDDGLNGAGDSNTTTTTNQDILNNITKVQPIFDDNITAKIQPTFNPDNTNHTHPQDNFTSLGDFYLYINGGRIVIDALGDGIDVNGFIEMSGGVVLVTGPTSNNNGAIDYDREFTLTGGLLIATGSSNMAQAPSSSSTQNSVLIKFSSILNAGELIYLEDSNGNEIFTFSPSREYQSIVFSSPKLTTSETYTLYYGGVSNGINTDNLYENGTYEAGAYYGNFTISNIITTINNF